MAVGDYGAFLAYGNFHASVPVTKTNSGPDLLPAQANILVLGAADANPGVTIISEPSGVFVLLALVGLTGLGRCRRDFGS